MYIKMLGKAKGTWYLYTAIEKIFIHLFSRGIELQHQTCTK
jgi:hypothetical protein